MRRRSLEIWAGKMSRSFREVERPDKSTQPKFQFLLPEVTRSCLYGNGFKNSLRCVPGILRRFN